MKNVRFGMIMALALAAAFLFFACASAPKEEVSATQTAIQAAQTEDVRTYAADSLKDAEDTMAKATAEIQTQDGKFAMSRDYKPASEMLKEAKDKAAKAQADAVENKTKVKAEAETVIASLTTLIADAKKALAGAPKGKDTKAEIEAMQNDLVSAEEAAAAATTAMSQEKYMDALGQANAAKAKADGVIEQVTAAKEKMKARR